MKPPIFIDGIGCNIFVMSFIYSVNNLLVVQLF